MSNVEDLKKGYFFIGLAAFQFGFQPFLVRWYTKGTHTSSIVLTCELLKIIFCNVALFVSGQFYSEWSNWTFMKSLKTAGLPAFLYVIINMLYQIAYLNLNSVLFNFLNQTKILFTALFLWIFLNRKQSLQQVLALIILLVSSTLLTLGQYYDTVDEESKRQQEIMMGIVPVLLGSLLSGITTAISQHVLQDENRSSYLYTTELAIWGMFPLFIAIVNDFQSSSGEQYNFFKKWSGFTLLSVTSNALGGIIVGLVVKFAGGVRKGFGTVIGMFLTAIFAFLIDDMPLNTATLLSLPLILISVSVHTIYPYKPPPSL